ncbi:Holliday junction branch migration protein RuvA [Corynebacterium yudongzhengii]|uniref:Holliday junction branch migration complex subunit RuvA n=1 Tax=Corynebacterium yudongzhengii TaxID=2080740 RepID=A0A2U1T460_9CORY|nr:Holliday junction branch migration protein RuvA [Corynebacterium yudongzhengii]AWB81798.1 Holliday junction branch migration protein RuvA [Corynebacterium yudongzhengii]PWC00789.1 Holliday junction branch migration protein RuvA [Corynebacterium yudongzhengii]
MIASLNGEVVSIAPDHAVMECAGVGYQFLATPRTLARLRRGENTRVLTHLAVREDAMTLYGFVSDEERRMFLLLQTLSGMGPKLALAVIGTLEPAEISTAVTNQDAKTLQTVPGVGKRMADRMVVELKDKVSEYLPSEPSPDTGPALDPQATQVAAQVTEALVGLGFTERVATPAVELVLAAEPELNTSAALKKALASLGKNK